MEAPMNLVQKLRNRRRPFKVYVGDSIGDEDGYIYDEYNENIFDIICSHIMFKLDLDYYWSYSTIIGWHKIWNIWKVF
tara:strand:- start:309 stop:542 length:234 start_codon:yes stop_codon:yes gene_type:complete